MIGTALPAGRAGACGGRTTRQSDDGERAHHRAVLHLERHRFEHAVGGAGEPGAQIILAAVVLPDGGAEPGGQRPSAPSGRPLSLSIAGFRNSSEQTSVETGLPGRPIIGMPR